jgi:hypothetical protein
VTNADTPLSVRDALTAELIRRCCDERDAAACAELDRRGVEPPVLELDDVVCGP